MSKITLASDVSGTGTFTIAAPNSNNNRTLTLPDASGTVQVSGNPISGTTGTFTETVTGTFAGNVTGNVTGNTSGTAGSVATANWTFTQSGSDIVASYNGTRRFKVDASGNAVVSGNVTAYGTV